MIGWNVSEVTYVMIIFGDEICCSCGAISIFEKVH